jgi:hypothetical protein
MENADNYWFTDNVDQHLVRTSKGAVEYPDVGQDIPVLYFHGNDVVSSRAEYPFGAVG